MGEGRRGDGEGGGGGGGGGDRRRGEEEEGMRCIWQTCTNSHISATQSGHKSHANLTAMSWVGGLGGKVFMSASMSSDFRFNLYF